MNNDDLELSLRKFIDDLPKDSPLFQLLPQSIDIKDKADAAADIATVFLLVSLLYLSNDELIELARRLEEELKKEPS